MKRAWLTATAIVAVACGGKVAPTTGPEPLDGPYVCVDCGPEPEPRPKPTREPEPEPEPGPVYDDAGPPPPPPHPTPARNSETWSCQPGEQVWMRYLIAPSLTRDGLVATCEGYVEFRLDPTPSKGSMADPNPSGGSVEFSYNGAGVKPSWAPHFADRPHGNNLTWGDGTTEVQYCTIFALCENGEARATGFSW